ncbi:MAG: DUF4369 domain-containing protein [Flavobacteriaceae bacterium]|nr:DUF4369 domain-containing protein [Flavobacteriaceae bacterium]
MKHTITKLFLIALLGSCSAPKKDMQVIVEVKDLKKGTLYLERVQDSGLVAVDSIFLGREEGVVLQADLDHPELFYILLDRNQTDDIDNRIPFFGQAGEISIQTTLDDYVTKAKVSGSPTQEIYNAYLKVIRQFNNEELDLIAAYLQAQLSENTDSLALVEQQTASLSKRKMLFTVNFAVNNANSVVAPYLALTELSTVSKSLLDTIASSMPDDVANSRYGTLLKKYLSDLEN